MSRPAVGAVDNLRYPRTMSDRSGPVEETPSPQDSAPAPLPAMQEEPVELAEEPFALTSAEEDEEQEKPSPARKIVLFSLLAVTLAGAGVLGYAGWRISSQKNATVAAPEKIGSLNLDKSEDGLSTAEYLESALAAEVSLDKTAGGVYSDGSANKVLFFGGTGLIWSPGNDLETAINLIADDQSPVSGVHDVDAGELGGTMRCGTTTADDTDMAVCGWSDHGSLALAMFPNRTVGDAAKLMLDIRTATQTRN